MVIHHIGWLVDDVDEAAEELCKLGFVTPGETVIDGERRARIAFLNNGGYTVELVQPIDSDSPVYGLRKRYGNSPYHICYQTEDMQGEIERLCASPGTTLIQEPRPAPAIQNAPLVAFLMSAGVGMIELVEIVTEKRG